MPHSLTETLEMYCVAAKFVPGLLIDEYEATVGPPTTLLSKFGPCRVFLGS
jgi:hypothetical protein